MVTQSMFIYVQPCLNDSSEEAEATYRNVIKGEQLPSLKMETVNAMTSIGRTFFVFGAQVGFVKQVKFLHWLKTLKYKP